MLLIKQHSFKRFSSQFFATDERSVSKLIDAFNFKPHRNLSFLSIEGSGAQPANQSIHKLIRFVECHRDVENLKLCYFTGISYMNDNFMRFTRSLLGLQTLCFVAFGELLTDNNAVMNHLCKFVQRCTTLQSIDISISQKSYEGHGGALENTKKFIFYTMKNQIYLQQQIEVTQACLQLYQKMPLDIAVLIVEMTFDVNGRFNININGLPDDDMQDVGRQFMKLKQTQSRNWAIARDMELFTHL